MTEKPYDFAELEKEIGVLPPYTCAAIDRVIKAVAAAVKHSSAIQKEDEVSEMHDLADSAERELADVEEKMEELREQNDLLRERANDWRRKCKVILDAWPESAEVPCNS